MESSPWKVPPGHFGNGPENIHIFKNFIEKDDVATISDFARTITEWSNDKEENEYAEDGTCTYNAAYWNNRQCSRTLLKKINPFM
jgi:hypothetical protein